MMCAVAGGGGGVHAGDDSLQQIFYGVSFMPDCARTGGGIAVAVPPSGVFYCPRRVRGIEGISPGAAFFFFVHEVGHLVLDTGNERAVDCWAAAQFPAIAGGRRQINAAIRFVADNTIDDARYGAGPERAARLLRCYRNALPAEP